MRCSAWALSMILIGFWNIHQQIDKLLSFLLPCKTNSKIGREASFDPVEITIKVKAENSPNIHQKYIKVRQYEKKDMMLRLLEIEKIDAMLVSARTKNSTMELLKFYKEKDILPNL